MIEAAKDPALRTTAIETLGRLRGAATPAIPTLKELLNDHDEWDHIRAAIALSLIEPSQPKWRDELIRGMGEGEKSKRAYAAGILWAMTHDSKKVLPTLIESLREDASFAYAYAFEPLAEIGPDAMEAVPLLLYFLKNGKHAYVELAARTLGRIGPEARLAVPELQEAAWSADISLRRTAKEALKRINGE